MFGQTVSTRKRGRSRRGAAAIEYALLLAVVLALLIIGVGVLGGVSRSSFSRVVFQSGEISNNPIAAPNGVADSGVASALTKKWQDLSPERQWQWAGIGTSIILNFVLWSLLYRRRQRKPKPIDIKRVFSEIKEADLDTVFEKRQTIHRFLSENRRMLFDDALRVRHLMSSNVVTVSPDMLVDNVIKVMRKHHVRQLLVCDASGKLLGVVGGRDLRGREYRTAGQAMIRQPFTVEPDTLIGPAVTQLLKQRATFLPVVQDGKVKGVLSTTDIVMAFQCTLQILRPLGQKADQFLGERRAKTISDVVAAAKDEAKAQEPATVLTAYGATLDETFEVPDDSELITAADLE